MHVLVHKEIKKIYTFCQSGKVATLRHLFQILRDADAALEDCNSKQKEDSGDEAHVGKELRRCIMQQILVWVTFAD